MTRSSTIQLSVLSLGTQPFRPRDVAAIHYGPDPTLNNRIHVGVRIRKMLAAGLLERLRYGLYRVK